MWWVENDGVFRAAEAFYMSRLNQHPLNKGQETGSVRETMDTIDLKYIYT